MELFKKKKGTGAKRTIDFDDDRINVLLLGNSGCGKSTLINAFLGYEAAQTGSGSAVTKNIEVYEDEALPFRMIDTVGFEYGLFKQYRIRKDLARFSKESVKNRDAKKLIHVIWYCIAGTAKRVDMDSLSYIKSVVDSWPGVPIIFVITKSYSRQEMEENRAITHDAVVAYNAKHPKNPLNVKDIICVVAKPYPVSEDVIVSETGLETLMNRTNELAPAAKQAADQSIRKLELKLKQDQANSRINTAAAASAAVGAVPIGVPDATILVPIQTRMIRDITVIYEQEADDLTEEIRKYILQLGATTIAGRALVKALKQVPGINAAASLVDAAVAGAVTFAAGKTSQIVFEKLYTGEWDRVGLNVDSEIRQIFKDLMPDVESRLKEFLRNSADGLTAEGIRTFLSGLLRKPGQTG